MGLEDNRKLVEKLLINNLDVIEPLLINQEQKEVYIDAIYSILGAFDGEICYQTNMLKVIDNHKEYYPRRLQLNLN